MSKAPGKSHRTGMTLIDLFNKFPNEREAEKWFENVRGKDGRHCPSCGSLETVERESRRPMPYHCPACRSYFSVRTGTVMASSRLPLQKWVIAIYLHLTSLKGVSSMKLHRDLGITQKSAWFLSHRIREALGAELEKMKGPVEVDETYIGGKERNKHKDKKLGLGRGGIGKSIVVGMKDRETNEVMATVVPDTRKTTLQGFVNSSVLTDASKYTDENKSYAGLENHETVNHTVGEYVNDMAHTNGIESFWSMLKRGYQGTYHRMSEKHLDRYVQEFSERHNLRELDTERQMEELLARMLGKRLMYSQLISE